MNMAPAFGDQRSPVKRSKKYRQGQSLNGYFKGDFYLIIRLSHSKLLMALARFLLLALTIVSLPWLASLIEESVTYLKDIPSAAQSSENLPLLFHDLKKEGLLKAGDKSCFISNGNHVQVSNSKILEDNGMDLISFSDLQLPKSIHNPNYDFIFTRDFQSVKEFIKRTLKRNGIVAIELNDDPSAAVEKPSGFNTVYVGRFGSTYIAMKRTEKITQSSQTSRRLLGGSSDTKKAAALMKLENVLLEPPRAASRKSRTYLRKTKYLPNLMGDTLEGYPRRVFINVGLSENDGERGTDWFAKHYPTRNLHFDIYHIATVTEDSSGKEMAPMGMSEWLTNNVKDEEFVVMKAEAEMVEEMVKSKAISLVDELFMDCKPQKGGKQENQNKMRRAHWECLALYGRLRDEGVAVHQWWG